jgi:YfiH family protein
VLLRRISETGIVYYVSPLLRAAGAPHGFSTRIGGVSIKPFDSLNLGNPQGSEIQDEWERIHENYRRLQSAAGLAGRTRCWVHQVHGGDVVFARQGHEFTNGARADALVSDDPQRALTIRVADCAPILLAGEDGRFVAAVHAGWRGVVAGVVPNAVRELKRMAGGDEVRLVAAIGPCIGQCAFEIGPEVVQQFTELFGSEAPIDRNGSVDGKGHLDLRRAVALQLMAAGVPQDRIDMTEVCTHRDADEFFSHRRERGLTGRMAGLISPAMH